MYVGELNFRTNRSQEARMKFGGVDCLVGTCCGVDSLEHVKQCFGYHTKPPANFREEDLIKYLQEINLERIRRWKAPLIASDHNSAISYSG